MFEFWGKRLRHLGEVRQAELCMGACKNSTMQVGGHAGPFFWLSRELRVKVEEERHLTKYSRKEMNSN